MEMQCHCPSFVDSFVLYMGIFPKGAKVQQSRLFVANQGKISSFYFKIAHVWTF